MATGAGVGLWVTCGAIEAGLILGFGPVFERGIEWPVALMGVLAAAMLVVGFVPAWLEIVRRKGRVIGLNMCNDEASFLEELYELMMRQTLRSWLSTGWERSSRSWESSLRESSMCSEGPYTSRGKSKYCQVATSFALQMREKLAL